MVLAAVVTMMINKRNTTLLRGTENNRTPFFFGGDFLFKFLFFMCLLSVSLSACSPSVVIDDLKKTFRGEKVLEGEQLTDIFRSNHSKESSDFKIVKYKFEKEDS